jgi:hypothetical protein
MNGDKLFFVMSCTIPRQKELDAQLALKTADTLLPLGLM